MNLKFLIPTFFKGKKMFLIKYATHSKFFFMQGLSVNLKHYEKKFRYQGSLEDHKIVSNGGCAAFVLFFIKAFENFGSIPTPKLFSNIKHELTDSDVIMPQIYLWMSMQHLIFDNFKTPNSSPAAYSPFKDPAVLDMEKNLNEREKNFQNLFNNASKTLAKKTYFKSLYDNLKNDPKTNYNVEQYNYLAETKERKFNEEMTIAQNERNEIEKIRLQYNNKTNFIKNKLRAEVNNNSADFDLLLDLYFMQKNLTHYNLKDVLKSTEEITDLNELIMKHHQVLAKSNNKKLCICFSTGIIFKKGAHKICFVLTNEYENQYLIFDPNFGLFSFKRMNEFLHGIKDLTDSLLGYRTIKYSANVFYLHE